MISMSINRRRLLLATSVVNLIEGWVSFRVASRVVVSECSRDKASVSSTYLF